ncbi:uncharacterized protein LOC110919414 [Helianthus annuus]|uniref:uncharacterized protein LOC110919414 n=1 Tax=Helianthus annuus TaxID=4232 RepID=UPI000B9007E4|nr:uncharacterized protein LOC110919414 [Helianthus annuus]
MGYWMHSYKIKGKNFWDIPIHGNMSWGWRKLLSVRALVRPFIWYAIRDGKLANAWNDNWCESSPLRQFITPRRIHNAGFNMQTTVSGLVDGQNGWRWPVAWHDLYPVLNDLDLPILVPDSSDWLIWKDRNGTPMSFSSGEVWDNIRSRADVVHWVDFVWFSQCIPRHSFHMWLVIKNKLKTQDRMSIWDAGSETNLNLMCCPLCRYDKDSRDHLFFRCSFSSHVWNMVKDLAYMANVDSSWSSVMAWSQMHASSKSAEAIVGKLVVAASPYFIWQERNSRLFTPNNRTAPMIANIVLQTVSVTTRI